MASAVGPLLAMGAILGGFIWLGTKKKKTTTPSPEPPQPPPPSPGTVEWTSGLCGTVDQIKAWFDSHPERFNGGVNTASQLPSREEVLAGIGPAAHEPGSLVVVVEDECNVYVWTGTNFIFNLQETNEMRKAISS